MDLYWFYLLNFTYSSTRLLENSNISKQGTPITCVVYMHLKIYEHFWTVIWSNSDSNLLLKRDIPFHVLIINSVVTK